MTKCIFAIGIAIAIHAVLDASASPCQLVELGIACATACLSHESACQGVRPAAEYLSLAREFPERPPPV